MSDTIAYAGGPWREFIFIDSSGTFTRTSWFSEDYVLNSGLLVDGENVVLKDSVHFRISRVDSFSIDVTSNWYHGRFHRSTPVTSEYFYDDWKRFVVGDASKKRMLGSWTVARYEMLKPDSTLFFPDDYLVQEEERPFLGGYPVAGLHLTFSRDNRLAITSDSARSDFKYLVDDDRISLSKSDYVFNYDYSLHGDSLSIIESRGVTKRELVFLKNQ